MTEFFIKYNRRSIQTFECERFFYSATYFSLPISSVCNIFRHPVHVKLWVNILCRRELYARTYYTSYIPKCGKARYNQSEGITIPKGGPFPNNTKDSTFWYPKVSSTRTEEAWVGG